MGRRSMVIVFFAALGVVALFGMWANVFWFLRQPGATPAAFGRALVANPAVVMLSIEMACMALACSVLMVREARRLNMPARWLVLFAALTLGFGVVFPLFLAARERRLPELRAPGPIPRATE